MAPVAGLLLTSLQGPSARKRPSSGGPLIVWRTRSGEYRMALALLTARILLAVVFLVAGLAKLADLAGSRQAVRDFAVPSQLATALGTLLPLAELTVAVTLLLPATAWWGALGALAL